MRRQSQTEEWMNPTEMLSGFAYGHVVFLLRAEGLIVFLVSVFAYSNVGGGLAFFLLAFLVPDLSMLGYLINARFGAICYNAAHNYLLVAAIALAGFLSGGAPIVLWAACVWAAHVGFDRLLGYGLKYSGAFGHTHLGLVGKLGGIGNTAK